MSSPCLCLRENKMVINVVVPASAAKSFHAKNPLSRTHPSDVSRPLREKTSSLLFPFCAKKIKLRFPPPPANFLPSKQLTLEFNLPQTGYPSRQHPHVHQYKKGKSKVNPLAMQKSLQQLTIQAIPPKTKELRERCRKPNPKEQISPARRIRKMSQKKITSNSKPLHSKKTKKQTSGFRRHSARRKKKSKSRKKTRYKTPPTTPHHHPLNSGSTNKLRIPVV